MGWQWGCEYFPVQARSPRVCLLKLVSLFKYLAVCGLGDVHTDGKTIRMGKQCAWF